MEGKIDTMHDCRRSSVNNEKKGETPQVAVSITRSSKIIKEYQSKIPRDGLCCC